MGEMCEAGSNTGYFAVHSLALHITPQTTYCLSNQQLDKRLRLMATEVALVASGFAVVG
jgi:hypothetical protein